LRHIFSDARVGLADQFHQSPEVNLAVELFLEAREDA
jgi:hypothetical protein